MYDLSRFAALHPGGLSVLLTEGVGASHELPCSELILKYCSYTIAGKDATDVFFSLHRLEVLNRPQYARLQIGTIAGQSEQVKPLSADEVSRVPYAEPTWLNDGFHSPYYNESHRRFFKAVRKFVMEEVYPEMVQCEETGKKISQGLVDKLA